MMKFWLFSADADVLKQYSLNFNRVRTIQKVKYGEQTFQREPCQQTEVRLDLQLHQLLLESLPRPVELPRTLPVKSTQP